MEPVAHMKKFAAYWQVMQTEPLPDILAHW